MSFNGSARETWSGNEDAKSWAMLGLTPEEVGVGHREEMKRTLTKISRAIIEDDIEIVEVSFVGFGLMHGDNKELPSPNDNNNNNGGYMFDEVSSV
jgi:hypothetical protein